jgi:hypothetical protein
MQPRLQNAKQEGKMSNYILVVILGVILLNRIKNTPSELSKKLYMKKARAMLNKDVIEASEDEGILLRIVSDASIVITYILFIALYVIINRKINYIYQGSAYITVLSILEVITCCYHISFGLKISKNYQEIVRTNNYEFAFQRVPMLINIIIDYLYYPVAICMLFGK